MKYKKWYAKSVTVEELETTVIEIQAPVDFRKSSIEYIRERNDGKFVVIWYDLKTVGHHIIIPEGQVNEQKGMC